MSGEDAVRRPAEPIDVTDDEVEQLAGRRAKPVEAVARMRKQAPAEATGRLVSDRAVPARVSQAELAGMRRALRRPDQVMRRLTPSEATPQDADAAYDERLAGPTRRPPGARR